MYSSIYAAMVLLIMTGCSEPTEIAQYPVPCSKPWYDYAESAAPTGDGMGHGPDPGSEEWKSVIEFKLGIRGNPEVPDRSSDAWCQFIDERIRA